MRLQKAAIALLTLLILASGIHFAQRSGTDPQTYSNDFNVYYFASREVIEGRDPYQNSLGEWVPYLYPPLVAEAFIPLALLPLPVAAYLWFLISAASLLVAAWMSVRLSDSDNHQSTLNKDESNSCYRRFTIALISLVVLTRFALDNFQMGQVNTVVMALAVAHIYMHSKNKKIASSIALALAISIKLTPALLVAYWLAKREWRFAIWCTAVSAILIALSFAPFGSSAPDAFSRFANRTIRNEQGFDLAYSGNQSLRGFLARLNDDEDQQPSNEHVRKPTDALALTLSLILLVLAIIAAAIARNAIAAAAPLFCCVVLLSPLAWKAHFIMLLLPVVNMVKESGIWSLKPSIMKRYSIVVKLIISFCVFNLTSMRIVGQAIAEWANSHSMVFAGAALILFSSIIIAFSNRKSDLLPRKLVNTDN